MVPWSSLGIRENVDKVLGMPRDAQEAVAVLSAVTMGLLTSECGVSCVSVACAGLLVTLAFLSCSWNAEMPKDQIWLSVLHHQSLLCAVLC